jgi:hypothetical protein
MVLKFDQPDPQRAEKEAQARALSDAELRALYDRTRAAAQQARAVKDMEELYRLVRGTKTLQRLADERGLIFRSRRARAERA